jgi:hypothetical protein
LKSFKFSNLKNNAIVKKVINYGSPFASALSIVLLGSNIAHSTEFNTYMNEKYHMEIKYPTSWVQRKAELSGGRDLQVFIDPNDSDRSVSVAFTAIPADYSKLQSFGGIETLRQYLLPKGNEIESEIITESIKGNNYFLEYVISSPENPKRHIQSIFALRPQESVVGVTIQSKEDGYAEIKNSYDDIAKSFKINDQ